MSTPTLFESSIKTLPFLHRGKVRDIYAVGDDKLLVIQSDRLSAFDVILPDPIPGKGEVLTAMSNFWFKKLGHVIPNHLTNIAAESVVAADEREQVASRAMVVRKVLARPHVAPDLIAAACPVPRYLPDCWVHAPIVFSVQAVVILLGEANPLVGLGDPLVAGDDPLFDPEIDQGR